MFLPVIKKFVIIAFIVNCALIGVLWFSHSDGRAAIHIFAVGQGDGIYIRTPEGYDIVIDGGPSPRAILSKLGRVMPFYDRTLDAVILSHPHADHIIGLIALLGKYRVKQVYLSGAEHNTPEYRAFLELLRQHTEIQKIKIDHQFTVEFSRDTMLEFLYPTMDVTGPEALDFMGKNVNNTSIVARFTHNKESALFTGDIEKEAEHYLVSYYAVADAAPETENRLQARILKVPHQGSKTSSTPEFLQAVNPTIAVIPVGAGNKYGHPHKETIDRLTEFGIKILRTDYDRDIVLYLSEH